jgi:hypothetical protein
MLDNDKALEQRARRAARRYWTSVLRWDAQITIAPPQPQRAMQPGRATAVRFSSTVSDLKMLRSCGTQPIPGCAR